MTVAHLHPQNPSGPQHFPVEASAKRAGDNSFNVAAHGLRGIASLMVFFAHLLGGTAEHVYASNSAYVDRITPFWNFGTFGVCLFFVISGFVILPSAIRYSPAQFAARRFLRLYPLFFALSLLFIVLNATTNFYPETNNLTAVLAGLTFLNLATHTEQLTPNAWSLTFEVWFYVFTAAFVFLTVRRPTRLGTIALGLLAALFVARYPIALYFLAGGLIRLAYDRYEWVSLGRHRLAESGALAACVFLASRGHYDYHWSDFQNAELPLLMVATGLYFFLAVSRNSLTALLLGNRLLRYFGTVSYSLYLVHPYTYFLTRSLFSRAHLFSDNVAVSMGAFILVAAAITWVLTHFANRTLELWPYEFVYHQKIYRSNSQPSAMRLWLASNAKRAAWLRG
ncbi:acyltransferase [Mesorhizobium sp. B292B1B]|uniref:acyltransferase family protein n=1 Tax=unclassified Mesorhizobium TaxID=325217 RepID=UPI0015E2F3DA|nr:MULTISPECIES: acyltransferase [unclassified Mesorhizobium]MCA0014334.1 acyltransferase [Mesorhizobium sp. B294B1A1]MCA0036505.1 acyltransferase [Mesorhizobium sp. B292B1B]